MGAKQRVVTFATRKAAEKWQKILDGAGPTVALAMLEQPEPATDRTVADQVRHHIDHLTGVTDGTRKTYRAVVDNDMAGLGEIPLTMLTRDTVAAWVNQLAARGLAGKSIANRHGLLSAAMNNAVADELIPANPCRGMRLPRTEHAEMVFLTREEFAHLYQLIPQHYQALVLTLAGTGMRFGEATALQVRDVDLEQRQIRIRQAWKHTGTSSQVELGPPKTRRGVRTVPVQPQLVEALRPLTAGRKPEAFLFVNTRRDPIKQSGFWKVWNVAVAQFAGDTTDEHGITTRGPGKRPRIHDLRHTFASWAISSGIPLPTIQRTLGHESITTTVDRYGHLARSDFDALAAATAANLPGARELEQ